ncbi:MAG TPA: glycerophosphodiester phosphodiesterase family protein [bacterium]
MGARRLLIIGHRGAAAMGPENTAVAIRAAAAAGADLVEVDVRLSADGVPVLMHDARLERTTDGRGRVDGTAYAALRRLDAGGWFSPGFSGSTIPAARETLRLVPERMGIIFELKAAADPRALRRGLLSAMKGAERTRLILSSCRAELLEAVGSLGCRRALVTRHGPDQALALAAGLRLDGWHLHYRHATPARIQRAHAAGLHVYVWTVNSRALAARMAERGADGIFTDDPALFVKLRVGPWSFGRRPVQSSSFRQPETSNQRPDRGLTRDKQHKASDT